MDFNNIIESQISIKHSTPTQRHRGTYQVALSIMFPELIAIRPDTTLCENPIGYELPKAKEKKKATTPHYIVQRDRQDSPPSQR